MQSIFSEFDRALSEQTRARVLLVSADVRVRLTLSAILSKVGYTVDHTGAPAEALDLLESQEYALVLCELTDAGKAEGLRSVVRFAKTLEYRPATAFITASQLSSAGDDSGEDLFVEPVDVPLLLMTVAELIGARAAHRARRDTRRAVPEPLTA